MDFKEFKKHVAYARKMGIKSFKVDGFYIEFNDQVLTTKKKVAAAVVEEDKVPFPLQEPTLQDINEYIYGATDETPNN